MRRARLPVAILCLAGASACFAEPELTGEEVFNRNCIHCHAAGDEHPGTRQLAMTRGEDRAVLQERDDLSAEYIDHIVRHGLISMPAFLPSDLTDVQLKSLVDYLTR